MQSTELLTPPHPRGLLGAAPLQRMELTAAALAEMREHLRGPGGAGAGPRGAESIASRPGAAARACGPVPPVSMVTAVLPPPPHPGRVTLPGRAVPRHVICRRETRGAEVT